MLTLDNILLLGLVTEFLSAAESFVHGWDNRGGTRGGGENSITNMPRNAVRRIVQTAERASFIRRRLNRLFDFKVLDSDQNQLPLVMDPKFSKGFCQIILDQLGISFRNLHASDFRV